MLTLALWLGLIGVLGAIPLVAYLLGRKSGRAEISAQVTEKTVDILRKQDAAAAEAPKTKDELIDRLRKGGL